uniref:Uncharacterized protein K02A2.6 n=2 Tax=Culex pipiens TaxID=7175 RepID=A0A8D8CKC9_CULPI
MASSSRIKPFEIDGDSARLPSEWETWKYDLEAFFLAQGIVSQRQKRAQLAYLGGPGLQGLLRHLPGVNQVPHVSADPPFYDVAIQCLDNYFEPYRRKAYERHAFHQIKQKDGENFTHFVMRLRKQIARCDYAPRSVDELIADRIALGCASEELRRKLLQKDRSLEEIMALGTSMAGSTQQSMWIGTTPKINHELGVSAIHKQRTMKPYDRNTRRPQAPTKPYGNYSNQSRAPAFPRDNPYQRQPDICYSCGLPGHTRSSYECPARGAICVSCGGKGHWAKACTRRNYNRYPTRNPGQNTKRIQAVKDEENNEHRQHYAFYAMGRNVFVFKVGGIDVPMTIDSGADCNIISHDVWLQMKEADVDAVDVRTGTDRPIMGYASSEPMKVVGTFKTEVSAGDRRSFAKFYVVEGGQQCLLGDWTAKDLQVLKVGFDVGMVKHGASKPFPKLRGIVAQIPIDKEVQPVQQPYRRPPIALEEKIKHKLESLLEQDIIEPVKGPSAWVSPMVPVIKDSGEIRLCIDMRQANQAVRRETHPLPLIDDLLGSVSGAMRFSKLDIKDAYHQIEISVESRAITTFITKYGLFR